MPQSAKTGVKLFVDPKYSDASGLDFADKASAEKVIKMLGKEYKVYAIDNPSHYTSNPSEPFKTSTLQQTAISSLG
jgi:DNA topoisomerase IA